MRFATLAAWTLLVAALAVAQNQNAMMRWGDAMLDKLAPFLPDAKAWGFTPEFPKPEPDFKAFANQGSSRYLALLVHKTWLYGDPELYRQLEEVSREKAAQKKESNEAIEEFTRVHGAEMQALEKSHAAEMNAASKRAQDLFRQGKYEEGKAVIDQIKPFHYAPLDSLSASLGKKAKELAEREKDLLARRRNVSFRIYTNRTPSTTAFGLPAKPIGTLAGRSLYRQDRGRIDMGGGRTEALVNLAVYLGPESFQNPLVKQGESELKVKCIVVWAWIESRPDTLQADEAAAKKVLAPIDYDGLSKLIEP